MAKKVKLGTIKVTRKITVKQQVHTQQRSKHSKFAILVLSKNFFAKRWPQRELDGILAKQEITGATPLPIWHNISFEEVYEFSPTLSGIFSLSSETHSVQDICEALKLQLEKEEIKG